MRLPSVSGIGSVIGSAGVGSVGFIVGQLGFIAGFIIGFSVASELGASITLIVLVPTFEELQSHLLGCSFCLDGSVI